jgi:hypothetical protein
MPVDALLRGRHNATNTRWLHSGSVWRCGCSIAPYCMACYRGLSRTVSKLSL